MTKYQKYFQEMLEENSELFNEFKLLHNKYVENPEAYQEELHLKGGKILEIIRNQTKGIFLTDNQNRKNNTQSNIFHI